MPTTNRDLELKQFVSVKYSFYMAEIWHPAKVLKCVLQWFFWWYFWMYWTAYSSQVRQKSLARLHAMCPNKVSHQNSESL